MPQLSVSPPRIPPVEILARGAFPLQERRKNPRGAIILPVRLRWLGPFALESEITHTLDAGRGGLLIVSHDQRSEGSPVWATLPYSSASAEAEPETPARVARCIAATTGGNFVGVAFDPFQAPANLRAMPAPPPKTPERRRHPRASLALCIRLTRANAPWPEETMTMNLSPTGLLFCSLRSYENGDRVIVSTFPSDSPSLAGKRRARIVRTAGIETDPRLQNFAAEFLS